MFKRMMASLGVSLLFVAGLVGLGATPAMAACPVAPSACFYYVIGSESHTAAGALALMDVLKPTMNTAKGDKHTLMELELEDATAANRIELGWTVDPGLNGDANPHLFTFYTVNGVTSGYNVGVTNCGGAVTTPTATPGGLLSYPQFPQWGIFHSGSYWWLQFGSGYVGCLPDTIWTSHSQTFVQGAYFQFFGEVASSHELSSGTPPCAQMGSGTKGSLKNTVTPIAARIGNVAYYNDTYTPNLYQRTSPAAASTYYDVGTINTRSFYLGGTGSTSPTYC